MAQTPNGTACWRKSSSTCSGSLTTIRAIAESVDSEMLSATTWVLCACNSFTTSSIAPTLFGRKIENCLTRGPSNFEVVCGRSTGMRKVVRPRLIGKRERKVCHRLRFFCKRILAAGALAGPLVPTFGCHLAADYADTADKKRKWPKPGIAVFFFLRVIRNAYGAKSRTFARIFSGLLCKSFVGGRLSVMGIRPTRS